MSMKSTWKERLHYKVDLFLAKGNVALFISLVVAFIAALILIGLFRLLLQAIAPDPVNDFFRQTWFVFLQLTDPGNMSQDTDTSSIFKITAVLAGLAGVVIFSALIAFLTTALDQAISSLKRGHSRVLEREHTLILGWGDRVIEILRELVEANESEPNPVVVIVSDVEKEQMDEYLLRHFTDRRNTRIVTRNGASTAIESLEHVNARHAKSAIILATCKESASMLERLDSDARVIKSVLALSSVSPDEDFPIITEVFNVRNRGVVADISPGRVFIVDATEILAKVMVQTARSSGLSVAYSELLSFEGCEMYFYGADWGNIAYGKLQYHFPDGVPIGIRDGDGEITIRPPLDRVLGDDDEVLIIAEDDSTIEFVPDPIMTPDERDIPDTRLKQRRERQLIIGWSPKAKTIVTEYADYVLAGSEVTVILKEPTESITAELDELRKKLDTLNIRLLECDPLDARELAATKPFSYHNVLILPQNPAPEKTAERIDSETIVVLLHLRQMQRDLILSGEDLDTKIVTEVLESANQSLVNQAGVDDFVISNRMVSMIFAQISEEPDIQQVYDDLFQEEGSEIYVKPAELYFKTLPIRVPFGDLMRAAQKRDEEVCIGYKAKAEENDPAASFGVHLIPAKDQMIDLQPNDGLVVVSEDDL